MDGELTSILKNVQKILRASSYIWLNFIFMNILN